MTGGERRSDQCVAARFIVTGRVQGVFFRASAREQARVLDVRGHARNLADGRVEVLAVGEAAAIERLGDWLQRGPPQAKVERVERRHADPDEAGDSFVTG